MRVKQWYSNFDTANFGHKFDMGLDRQVYVYLSTCSLFKYNIKGYMYDWLIYISGLDKTRNICIQVDRPGTKKALYIRTTNLTSDNAPGHWV